MPLAPADDLTTVESAAVDAATGQSQRRAAVVARRIAGDAGRSAAVDAGESAAVDTGGSAPVDTGGPLRRHRWVRPVDTVGPPAGVPGGPPASTPVGPPAGVPGGPPESCRWVCRRLWPRVVRRRRFLVLRQWSRLDRRRHPQPARRRPCPVTHLACRQACRSWCRGHRRRPAPERSAPHPSVESAGIPTFNTRMVADRYALLASALALLAVLAAPRCARPCLSRDRRPRPKAPRQISVSHDQTPARRASTGSNRTARLAGPDDVDVEAAI